VKVVEDATRTASLASHLLETVAAREVIARDPRRSFRAVVHDYPTPVAGWHYHPELEIHLITASIGTHIAGDYIGSFGPGQVTLMGSGLPHDWVSDLAPGEVVRDRDHVIQFDREWLLGCSAVIPELAELDQLVRDSARGLVFTGRTAEEAATEIKAVVGSRGAVRIAHMLRLLALMNNAGSERQPLAGEWFVNPGESTARAAVEAGVSYIFGNLDGGLRLSTAAGLAHMSPSAFSRYFKSASGLTFSAMVRKLRVATACRLLETTEMSVSSISTASGYQNLANFNRQFLRETDMTPGQYRRSIGGSGAKLPPGALKSPERLSTIDDE
jgi:AraC-like DNA-binding protein